MDRVQIEIYNLEFPDNVLELNVGEYCFKQAPDYKKILKELSHSYNSTSFEVNQGSHRVTALALLPSRQKVAILPWNSIEVGSQKPREFLDILLVLSLLTGRNIIAKTWRDAESRIQIIEDPRQHRGNFGRFVLPVGKAINNQTREIISEVEINGLSAFEWLRFDQGLEIAVNKVCSTIKDEVWQKKYSKGAFLLIFAQAQKRQCTESAFILSWSIWEHIFSLHHSLLMNNKEISKMSVEQKYRFVRNEYFLDGKEEENAEKIEKIRNRLIHFGFFPQNGYKDQNNKISEFFSDTEYLVAKILNLV